MVKPKAEKRKGDAVQVAHSVFRDALKLTEQPIKSPAKPKRRK
jgi:hypothetical protein